MGEIRRDTVPMNLDEIHAAFESQRRDTLPIPLALEIAEAQCLDATLCPGCGCGIVPQTIADRIAEALAVDPDEEQPITVVEAAQ
jgi:2-polyprenyl-3-methyl-5-hydroxy-6-metoxy-1,4-benzoquinol methylase